MVWGLQMDKINQLGGFIAHAHTGSRVQAMPSMPPKWTVWTILKQWNNLSKILNGINGISNCSPSFVIFFVGISSLIAIQSF